MPSMNKVILMGNLTRDPKLRSTPGGKSVTDLDVAINEKTKDRERTTFVKVTAWNRQAETCAEYLHKGSAVLVEGRLQLDEWEDRDTGKKRSMLSVQAHNVQFLSGDSGGGKTLGKPNRHDDAAEQDDLESEFDGDDVPF